VRDEAASEADPSVKPAAGKKKPRKRKRKKEPVHTWRLQ